MLHLKQEAFLAEYKLLQERIATRYGYSHLHFSVMHGNGNVFILVDESLNHVSHEHVNSHFAREMCGQMQAIKIDGISFLRRTEAGAKMTFFDRDGTAEPMCGNGLRCSALYAYHRGYITAQDRILTDDGIKPVEIRDGQVSVNIGHGREFQRLPNGHYFVFSSIPHLVIFVDDVLAIDVKKCGAAWRYNQELCEFLGHPEGIHVNFLQVESDLIRIRTYEVGVEDETLSCGSGVAGAAFVVNRVKKIPFPLRIQTNYGAMSVDENRQGLTISGIVEYLFTPSQA